MCFDRPLVPQLVTQFLSGDESPSGARSSLPGHQRQRTLVHGTDQGKSHIQKGNATLNGVVTEGWALGAQVHVTFDRVSCAVAPNGVCFEGTIRVMPGSAH